MKERIFLEQIYRAYMQKAINPAYHDYKMKELQRTWPSMASAIQDMVDHFQKKRRK